MACRYEYHDDHLPLADVVWPQASSSNSSSPPHFWTLGHCRARSYSCKGTRWATLPYKRCQPMIVYPTMNRAKCLTRSWFGIA